MGVLAIVGLSAGATTVLGCGGDSSSVTGVKIEDLAGTYSLTKLAFDPQGALPEADIMSGLGASPELIVSANNQAQIVFQDPITLLFTTIGGSVKTTKTGARIAFSNNSDYADLLLSKIMEFDYAESTRTLTFDGDAPDGVRRQNLIRLVEDWADEQLFDPVPGRLQVTFQRN